MMYTLLILVFAKPIYWLGKITYLYYKNPGGIQAENPDVTQYKTKLLAWLSRVWDVISWQKDDL